MCVNEYDESVFLRAVLRMDHFEEEPLEILDVEIGTADPEAIRAEAASYNRLSTGRDRLILEYVQTKYPDDQVYFMEYLNEEVDHGQTAIRTISLMGQRRVGYMNGGTQGYFDHIVVLSRDNELKHNGILGEAVETGGKTVEEIVESMRVQITPEGKPLLADYFGQWYDRVYFLGEEPGAPQEGDLRIDSVRFLGSEPTYETTGEAYAVKKSYYSARREQGTGEVVSKWRAEGEEYIVMGRSMDGDLYEVRGKRLALREDIARTIFEVSYDVSDWEVTLWHDKNLDPWPLALGRWSDEPLSLVDGEPTIERLDGWEPIYKDGDYWNRCTLDGLSIRRYYNSSEDYHGNYNIELTRDDFATLRGIRLGSTRDEVKAVYPELKSGDYWTLYPSEDYLWYCEDELDFGPALIFFFENDKVSKIVLNNMFN